MAARRCSAREGQGGKKQVERVKAVEKSKILSKIARKTGVSIVHMLRGVSVRLQCHCFEHGTLAGQLLVRGKATQLASKKPTNLSLALTLLSSKDAQMQELRAAKDMQLMDLRAAMNLQLEDLRAAKDALQDAKDALQDAKDAVQSELHDLTLMAQHDALHLAIAQRSSDKTFGIVGAHGALGRVTAELTSDLTDTFLGVTDRLLLLAKGERSIPGLNAYVQECAKANSMDPGKALEMLPRLYRELSGHMHPTLSTSGDRLIEAMLSDNPTALLLVSCMFKLTSRDLLLYRDKRLNFVVLNIKQPSWSIYSARRGNRRWSPGGRGSTRHSVL